MATLAEAVDAAETDWLVSADIPDSVDYLTVGSEVVQVTATFPAQYQARDGSTSDPRIRVVRAAGGTTAASHADGTTLTPLIPPSSAGGGAAEPGTVVVTPGGESAVAAGLEGLPPEDAPAEGNPYMTQSAVDLGTVLASGNDAGGQGITGLLNPTDPQDAATKDYVDDDGVPTLGRVLDAGNDTAEFGSDQEIVAKDAGIVRAAMSIGKNGVGGFSIKDALGVEVASLVLDETTLTISTNNGAASIAIAAGGGIALSNAGGTISITAIGEVLITATIFKLIGLPTAPGNAGELYSDSGIVTVA